MTQFSSFDSAPTPRPEIHQSVNSFAKHVASTFKSHHIHQTFSSGQNDIRVDIVPQIFNAATGQHFKTFARVAHSVCVVQLDFSLYKPEEEWFEAFMHFMILWCWVKYHGGLQEISDMTVDEIVLSHFIKESIKMQSVLSGFTYMHELNPALPQAFSDRMDNIHNFILLHE